MTTVRKRVLVADDDSDVCALVQRVLAPVADVVTAADAETALSFVRSGPPFDAIISDFMLPGLTGLEFVALVRGAEAGSHVPILMISGHGSQEVGSRARAVGVDAFLNKPFTLAELRSTVATLL